MWLFHKIFNSLDGHLDSFHFLIIMNSVAMNILKCIYFEMELLGYKVCVYSVLVYNATGL